MIRILLVIMIALLPLTTEAAYKIFLKNGSAITGVQSYEKQKGEVLIHFGGGTVGVPERDILKIEETGGPERDFRVKESPQTQPEKAKEEPPLVPESPPDRNGRAAALRAELESISAELTALDEEEARLKASIDEKRGKRFRYNVFQLRQIEKEIEPLQQELFSLQHNKSQMVQRKAQIEGELQGLQ